MARLNDTADELWAWANKMLKFKGSMNSCSMTSHGGVAVWEDVQNAFDNADKWSQAAEDLDQKIKYGVDKFAEQVCARACRAIRHPPFLSLPFPR